MKSEVISRILIVGLGSIGRRHLRLARQMVPNADIRVLRRNFTDEIPEFSNGCFFGIEEALEFRPQIAVIANPAPFHIDAAKALAQIGVNLLIEKPLAAALNGVVELIDTCNSQGITVSTGYNLRFLPSLRQYRDFLDSGIVGKILSVRCEVGQYLPSWRPDCDYRETVSARHELGGGALLELSHEIDYLRWIFGEVDWVKASLSRQSGLDINVEDTAHLIIGFAPMLEGSRLIASVNLDFIRHDTTRLCVAIGEKGSLRWNGLTGEVAIYQIGTKEWRILFSNLHQRDDSYVAQWENFIECCVEQKIPLVTGEDGLKVLQIVEAVRNSENSGGHISIVEAINKGKNIL